MKIRAGRGSCRAAGGALGQQGAPLLFLFRGKFKKNVTIQFFYPHAINMEYFYLSLSLKGVF